MMNIWRLIWFIHFLLHANQRSVHRDPLIFVDPNRLESCLFSLRFLLRRKSLSTYQMMRSNNRMHQKPNPNLNTIMAVTTIVTNYNRSNHISGSRLIFFIICLLIRLWSIFFSLYLLAIVTHAHTIYRRMNERNEEKQILSLASRECHFLFRSWFDGRTFLSPLIIF